MYEYLLICIVSLLVCICLKKVPQGWNVAKLNIKLIAVYLIMRDYCYE